MGDSPTIDTTRTIASQAGAAPASLAACQHDLLQDAQQRMTVWMRRRQEALDTGLDALTRMSACKTPIEMAVIYGEWLTGGMTRVLADLEDGQAHAARMAKHVQEASRAAFALPLAEQPAEPTVPAAPAEIPQPVATAEPAAPQQLREAA